MDTWRKKFEGFKQTISDGCTMSPDLNFRECCEEHDFYYTKREKDTGVNRKEADKKLRQCMCYKYGWIILPWFYWAFVRCCGWTFWKK